MAQAAGLPMVGEHKNPAKTTTFGVGSLIRDAVEQGCKNIVSGLGGAAPTTPAPALPRARNEVL